MYNSQWPATHNELTAGMRLYSCLRWDMDVPYTSLRTNSFFLQVLFGQIQFAVRSEWSALPQCSVLKFSYFTIDFVRFSYVSHIVSHEVSHKTQSDVSQTL